MHPALRARFNAAWTPARYAALLHEVNETERWPADFRLAETPVFLTPEFYSEVTRAAEAIVEQLRVPAFAHHAADAIPAGLSVPGETAHPAFLQIDFAICEDEADPGHLTPRLIELQGFPSLYAFQPFLLRGMRAAFGGDGATDDALPADWTPFPDGMNEAGYLEALRRVVIADANPENVILLEIEPDKQKTRIDFACTETMLGVRPVSLTDVFTRGDQLFYRLPDGDGAREVRVERIYNRVIFDELLRRPDLRPGFDFHRELDVTWVGHPSWYFRVSKHSLPFLKTSHTSPAFFADEFPAGEDLADYVLKPLYSFAGLGVDMDPTREKLAALPDPRASILQKKVTYAEFLPTPDGGPRTKAEIRMMFLWPENGEPQLVNNLVRLSQGRMMGVDFNRNKTWVGASIALHPPAAEAAAEES